MSWVEIDFKNNFCVFCLFMCVVMVCVLAYYATINTNAALLMVEPCLKENKVLRAECETFCIKDEWDWDNSDFYKTIGDKK